MGVPCIELCHNYICSLATSWVFRVLDFITATVISTSWVLHAWDFVVSTDMQYNIMGVACMGLGLAALYHRI